MPNILTKAELYQRAAAIREELGIPEEGRVEDVQKLLSSLPSLAIEAVPFQSHSLQGICKFGSDGKPDVILLNSNRPLPARNFDCMHEYIHLHEHRHLNKDSFCSMENVTQKQDPYLEWQANEGAAETLVPYRSFLPLFAEYLMWTHKGARIDITDHIGDHYHVSSGVIANRIRSLSFEIEQYLHGVPLRDVLPISAHRLQQADHTPPDYLGYCLRVKPRSDYYNRLIPIQEVLSSYGQY